MFQKIAMQPEVTAHPTRFDFGLEPRPLDSGLDGLDDPLLIKSVVDFPATNGVTVSHLQNAGCLSCLNVFLVDGFTT